MTAAEKSYPSVLPSAQHQVQSVPLPETPVKSRCHELFFFLEIPPTLKLAPPTDMFLPFFITVER